MRIIFLAFRWWTLMNVLAFPSVSDHAQAEAMDRKSANAGAENTFLWRLTRLCCALLMLLMVVPGISRAQTQPEAKPPGAEPTPKPAVPAILAAFDKYEVVAMPEAHGMKDMDDFILSLIRNPAFPEKVNDIEVECGNSLYQPVLDRYIAGEDVPFTEVRKVWRNTTQSMCGESGFFEQFFPLVRVINQKLAPAKRIRVLAGDPPIEWDKVKSREDAKHFLGRSPSITSVMEKEVLSKHRKALMLFGLHHIFHVGPISSVSIYEKDYPNVTFVIDDIGPFYKSSPGNPFATWPVPSLVLAKGTWLGALDLGHFLPPPFMMDHDCKVHNEFPKPLQKPMEELVDAFLYLGPPDLSLKEQLPADIALDVDYEMQLPRRESLQGLPPMSRETNQEIVDEAENPLYDVSSPPPDTKLMEKDCLDRKSHTPALK
jgi:hypothetical protein